jgi:hypothetical protein
MRHALCALVVVRLVSTSFAAPHPPVLGMQLTLAFMGWGNYVAANPTTRPRDVRIVRAAIQQIPEPLQGPVRMEDIPGIEGQVRTRYGPEDGYQLAGPPEIWLSRRGSSYRSGNPLRVAGTLVHENAHLNELSELDAREKQLEFLRQAIGPGDKAMQRFLKSMEARQQTLKDTHAQFPEYGFLTRPVKK